MAGVASRRSAIWLGPVPPALSERMRVVKPTDEQLLSLVNEVLELARVEASMPALAVAVNSNSLRTSCSDAGVSTSGTLTNTATAGLD